VIGLPSRASWLCQVAPSGRMKCPGDQREMRRDRAARRLVVSVHSARATQALMYSVGGQNSFCAG
jgi:hypothetical protein